MKANGGMDVWLDSFLTSVQHGHKWSASQPRCFTSTKISSRPQLNKKLGGPQGQSGEQIKLSPLSGIERLFLYKYYNNV
jgi:hypothetical protein